MWTNDIQSCGTVSDSNVAIIDRFQSMLLRAITAPFPNGTYRKFGQTWRLGRANSVCQSSCSSSSNQNRFVPVPRR